MSKTAYLVLCLLAGFILESLFQLNVYVLIIIMTVIFAYFWHIAEQAAAYEAQKEHQELQVKVQSTSKDAHLKLKQLTTMVSSIPSPLFLLDQFGVIVLHNDVERVTLSTYEGEETYLQNGYAPCVKEFIKDAFILEKHLERRMEISGIVYQVISVPVMSLGKFSGCLILMQDISKALEGERMQKQFLADASHELKTPIAVIKGMLEILNRDDFCDPQVEKDFLYQMEQETKRLEELVKDILTLSKLANDHPVLDRRKIDMREIIEAEVNSMRKAAEEKGLTIKTTYAYEEAVFCDPMRMRQVVTNLLSNAIKYSEQGTIDISLAKEDADVVFSITDCGCGLHEEQLAHIFERFYRVKDDRSRNSGGSGLGLAIVKSIVEAHKGQIKVFSEVGKGTTFQVYLKN